MTRNWSPSERDTDVTAIAHTPELLVALDFDGTASPLVMDPMSARAIPEVKHAVAALSALPHTTVAFVSGRSLNHLREIAEHADDSVIVLAGSHGAEFWYPGEGAGDEAQAREERMLRDELLAELASVIAEYPGVELESKAFGIGVHGRPAHPDVERAAFRAVDDLFAARARHWRRRTGDRILEFSSRSEGKDSAIRVLRERLGATAVLFAGDDVTDEDALRTLTESDLGVRVGPGESAAKLRVDSPQMVAELLGVIASERAGIRQ